MIDKCKELFLRYKELILYVFFGGLTTLVNMVIYFSATKIGGVDVVPADILAWIVSVLFAFVVNKIWVFESRSWSVRIALPQFGEFIGARAVSLLADVAFLYITVEMLCWWDVPMKILSNVIVIVINYIFSKLVIFKKKETSANE